MATLVLSNGNFRVRVTYTCSNGTFKLTELEGCRTDGYNSYRSADKTVTVKVGSTSKSVTVSPNIYFQASSSYKAWGATDTTWTGVAATSTVAITVTMPTSEAAYSKMAFSGNATHTLTTYTNTVVNYVWGFTNGEGTTANKDGYLIENKTFTAAYGSSYTMNAAKGITAPSGMALKSTFGTSAISGSWANYAMGTSVTQKAAAMWYEYDYSPVSYSITYALNSGTNASSNPTTYTYMYPTTIANPTKTGHTFQNWTCKVAKGTFSITASHDYSYQPLTVHMIPGMTYTITADSAVANTGSPTQFQTAIYDFTTSTYIAGVMTNLGSNISYTITCPSTITTTNAVALIIYAGAAGSTTGNKITWTNMNISYTISTGKLNNGISNAFTDANSVLMKLRARTAGNITLTANWKANTYSVSYNANGGSGAPSAQTKTYGVDLTLSSTKPTKSNTTATGYTVTFNKNGGNTPSKASATATNTTKYTFSTWNTAAAGTGTSYAAGAKYTTNAAATLYAQYTSSTTKGSITCATCTRGNGTATRTVTINANSGTSTVTSRSSTATVTYTCNGWYTAASGGTKRAASGGSYTPSATETLYAQWGSSTGTFSAVTLPTASQCTRTGYTLLGFSTSSTATSATYSPGASYTPSANVTLYAVWKINTWTVSYNANGGSGAPSAQTKTYGTALTLSSTKPTKANTTATGYTVTFNKNGGNTPSKTSATATDTTKYTFSKWNTKADGSGTNYSSGGSYTANAAATLYAQYTSSTTKGAITCATCTRANGTSTWTTNFNANGGSSTKTSQTSTATITYTCNGWFTAASGGTKRAASGGSYTPSATETVYAQWGSSTGTRSTITFPTASQCTRTGYNLLGFSTSSSATTQSYGPGASYTPTANSQTFYAVWKLKTYTIKFNANGGSGAPSGQTKTHGTALTLSSTVPTRTRHTFLGWSTDKSATSATYSAGGSFTTEANTTLYAIWRCDDKRIYLYKTGIIEALKFIEVTSITKNFDKEGNVYATAFIEHTDANFKIDKDGKMYAKSFVEI